MTALADRTTRRAMCAWLLAALVPPIAAWALLVGIARRARTATPHGPHRAPHPFAVALAVSVGALLVVPAVLAVWLLARSVRRLELAAEPGAAAIRPWLCVTTLLAGAVLVGTAQLFASAALAWTTTLVGLLVAYAHVGLLQFHLDRARPRPATRPRAQRVALAVALTPLALAWSVLALSLTLLGASGDLHGYHVLSGSMAPSYRCGDRFLVEQVTHRSDHPERGDVVAFRPPSSLFTDAASGVVGADTLYFKRVVGLPGERVAIRNGRAIVDGRALAETYAAAGGPDSFEAPLNDLGEFRVPDDSYFLLGDDRDNSADSRVFGGVPRANLAGRVVLTYWPLDHVAGSQSTQAPAGERPVVDPSCLDVRILDE